MDEIFTFGVCDVGVSVLQSPAELTELKLRLKAGN